jgi:hypothetical protein
MRRRELIAGLAGAAAWPVAAWAQQPAIGWLDLQSPEAARESVPALRRSHASENTERGVRRQNRGRKRHEYGTF